MSIILETSDCIAFRIPVNRNCTWEETILSTRHSFDRSPYGPSPENVSAYKRVIDQMPRGGNAETEVVFFRAEEDHFCSWGLRYVTHTGIDAAYKKLGLIPADGYSLCAVNAHYPDFSKDKTNHTYWRIGGTRYSLSFSKEKYCISRCPTGGLLRAYRNWFAGIRV
ncbi:MAG: hypothetical protein V4469_05215 [Patescibacteria group bacterium]